MSFLKNIFRAFIFSNCYIALAAALILVSTCHLLGLPVSLALVSFVFFSTLFVYLFQRLVRTGEGLPEYSERHCWIEGHKTMLYILGAIAFSGALVSLVFCFNSNMLLFLIPIAILCVGYVFIPIKMGGANKQSALRQVPYLKLFLIALVWAVVTVIFPLYTNREAVLLLSYDELLVFIQRFSFIVAITLPFDIRDLHNDSKQGVKTLPAVLGVQGAKLLAQFILFFFSGTVLLQYFTGTQLDLAQASALIISAVITSFIIAQTHEKRKEYFYTFLVDGTLIIQAFLVYIATLL